MAFVCSVQTLPLCNSDTSVMFKGIRESSGRYHSFHFCFQTEVVVVGGGGGRGGSLLQGQAWPWDPAGGDKGPLRVNPAQSL